MKSLATKFWSEVISYTYHLCFSNIHAIKTQNAHLIQVNEHIHKLQQQEEQADKKVSTERSKLAEAFKKLSIIEKVKENEHGTFVRDMEKADQKFMDEISFQSLNR